MGAPISVRSGQWGDDDTVSWRWYVEDQNDRSRFYDYGENDDWTEALADALHAHRQMVEDEGVTITRDNQQTDVIYVGPSAWTRGHALAICATPDGVGRYYYDSTNEARADLLDEHTIRYVSRIED